MAFGRAVAVGIVQVFANSHFRNNQIVVKPIVRLQSVAAAHLSGIRPFTSRL
ncbi:hypothetical protein [Nostoc sp. MG11]|uniref:hypothetical protein n=1 Tax=Nostoc sp. MG11 TaxID=2721166 RepID=UPI001865ABA3|nr:hypothetical protein [Nostoc sp. MG11]